MNEWGGALVPSFYAAMVTNVSQEKRKDLSLSGQSFSLFLPVPVLPLSNCQNKKCTPLNPVDFLTLQEARNKTVPVYTEWRIVIRWTHIQIYQCLYGWNTPETSFSLDLLQKQKKKLLPVLNTFCAIDPTAGIQVQKHDCDSCSFTRWTILWRILTRH